MNTKDITEKIYHAPSDTARAVESFMTWWDTSKDLEPYKKLMYVVGIPKGGVVFAGMLYEALYRSDSNRAWIPISYEEYTERMPKEQQQYAILVDDIIDSGRTFKNTPLPGLFVSIYGRKGLVYNHTQGHCCQWIYQKITKGIWINFWWEGAASGPEDAVVRQLEYIGEDPDREGLKETPKRVIKAWDKLFEGYKKDPKELLKTFTEGACDELVLLKDIEYYSMCEHHLLPFFGKAHIAYIPNGNVIGVSKLARLLDIFARRAQIQERIGDQVTSFLMEELQAKGAACIIEGKHLCMVSRGVEKQNSIMTTSSLKGVFKHKAEARMELLALINN